MRLTHFTSAANLPAMRTPRALRLLISTLFISFVLFTGSANAEPVDAAEFGKNAPALMLPTSWTPAVDPTGWWMSEKYDGVRAYWDGRHLWTRRGVEINAPRFWLAELPAGVPLDGELWIDRGKFEETVSVVFAQPPDDRWNRVRYMVSDSPRLNSKFEERMTFLRDVLPSTNRFAIAVPQRRCKGAAQLVAERDRIVADGGEGLLLHRPSSDYEIGKSSALLRVHCFDDAEATVIAHLEGKGRLAGKLGSLRVRTPDGREFAIGIGFSDAQRTSPPPIGSTVTYRFRGLTAKGLPRFPSFLHALSD